MTRESSLLQKKGDLHHKPPNFLSCSEMSMNYRRSYMWLLRIHFGICLFISSLTLGLMHSYLEIMQFVDLLGDFEAIKKAEARHRQLFPSRKSTLDSKKRPSAEVAGQDRAKILKPYVVTTVTPAPVISNGQVQWTTAYAPTAGYVQSQSQGWQQATPQPATQVQPQQWTQSYATYGGYTTYAAQPQASVPQPQTVYASYAPAYAPQVNCTSCL